MAECKTCNKVLVGSWNMTTSGNECDDKTGRYIGVTDGYFLYGNNANWVYSYCHACWEKEINQLPFVQQQQQELANRINALEAQNSTLQVQYSALEAQHSTLQAQYGTLEAQHNTIKAQNSTYQTNETALNNKISSLTAELEKCSLYATLALSSGLEKLKNIFQQFTEEQISMLKSITSFSVLNFQTKHRDELLKFLSQSVSQTVEQVQLAVKLTVQFQQRKVDQLNQAQQEIGRILNNSGVSNSLLDESQHPLKAEILRLENDIEQWNKYSSLFMQFKEELDSVNSVQS